MENEKSLIWSFNLDFRYIDDVLSLNKIDDSVYCIYAIQHEIRHTTDTPKYNSYLDLHLDVDSEGSLRTEFYDKRDDFNL